MHRDLMHYPLTWQWHFLFHTVFWQQDSTYAVFMHNFAWGLNFCGVCGEHFGENFYLRVVEPLKIGKIKMALGIAK